jgi:hypothetical protein
MNHERLAKRQTLTGNISDDSQIRLRVLRVSREATFVVSEVAAVAERGEFPLCLWASVS